MDLPWLTISSPSAAEEAIKIVVRVRPCRSSDDGVGDQRVVSVPTGTEISLDIKPEPRNYTFDYVADEYSTQESIFNAVGKSVTENCILGYNGTVFA